MTQDLLLKIVQYEQQLHRLQIRRQKAAIEKLLHRDFFEIGRSGKRYDRQQVINSLLAETVEQNIGSDQYALTPTGSAMLLLTYRTYVLSAGGEKLQRTLRTSLWVNTSKNDDNWQMLFHQGTPEADCTGV